MYSKDVVRILIIDSGVDISHPCFHYENIQGINILDGSDNIEDQIGHGTAVASILAGDHAEHEIYAIKMFTDSLEEDEETFLDTLRYVGEHFDQLKPDIIHISAGVTMPIQLDMMKRLCKSLIDKGCIIVAAFDNFGAISYPAAFPFVVGVDLSLRCFNKFQYEFLPGSLINFVQLGTINASHG